MDALSQKVPLGNDRRLHGELHGQRATSPRSTVPRALPYSLGGNRQFQVDVTDNGEPGSKGGSGAGHVRTKVWETSGTYYQVAVPPAQRALEGGNIQVRP
jgi:hypothetical protein